MDDPTTTAIRSSLALRVKYQAEQDRELLTDLRDREARIADAATRTAWVRAATWLSDKQAKSEQFPGGDLDHAKGRAAAYQNAAQELFCWAISHGDR
jgi:hypothetical protein